MQTYTTYPIIGSNETITFHGVWDSDIWRQANEWERRTGRRLGSPIRTEMY
jgi:hypothetical protein